jgi:hypothetical protein
MPFSYVVVNKTVTVYWDTLDKIGAGTNSSDFFVGSGGIPTAIRPAVNIPTLVWTADSVGLAASWIQFETDGGFVCRKGTSSNAWSNVGNATIYSGSITWRLP